MKSRRRKCRVDSKRGAFDNSNRPQPTPDTTVLPRRQDNPLLHRRRRAFHLIRLPLRRLPHPLHPLALLPSHPLPLAQDSIARLVAMAAHLPHPLIAKMALCMLCVCSASMMTRIALSVQRTQLAKSAQRVFECSICMEEMPMDSIARIDSCGHTFCRECLRGHISARIDEHRFPVLCPTCTANNGNEKGKAGGTCRSVWVTPSSRDFLQRFHNH